VSGPRGWQLMTYLVLRRALEPLMYLILQRRLSAGKEDPARVYEKLGRTTQVRPNGTVVWLHAVGLGEVLALRPLIKLMQESSPELSFVVTSTARSSANVMAKNLPARCVHQFLPLDGPTFVSNFLNHWRPNLAIWSEQDLWPGAIHDCAARGIPLAHVNARMNDESHRRKARFSGLYRDTFACFSLVAAQDSQTADNLREMGVKAPVVTGSLKPAAAPLAVDTVALERFTEALADRRIWVAASTHLADENVAFAAQKILAADDPSWLLVVAPRFPERRAEVASALQRAGLTHATRSQNEHPNSTQDVWLADSFGELGLWYRLGKSAFIGGSFAGLGGHNPWEAICLSCPVFHGPDIQNFAADYAELDRLSLSHQVQDDPSNAEDLAREVQCASVIKDQARTAVKKARENLKPLVNTLTDLIKATP
jgi:3-deoxy-D-manno-octulosonic-acid transferase